MSNKITIGKDLARDITFSDYCESEVKVIKEYEWEVDGKYQTKEIIFEMNNKNYRLIMNRSGDYYSDYYYDWEDENEFECHEVKPKEITIVKWVNV